MLLRTPACGFRFAGGGEGAELFGRGHRGWRRGQARGLFDEGVGEVGLHGLLRGEALAEGGAEAAEFGDASDDAGLLGERGIGNAQFFNSVMLIDAKIGCLLGRRRKVRSCQIRVQDTAQPTRTPLFSSTARFEHVVLMQTCGYL